MRKLYTLLPFLTVFLMLAQPAEGIVRLGEDPKSNAILKTLSGPPPLAGFA